MKKVLFSFLLALLLMMPIQTKASETSDFRSFVSIKATVPEEITQDITLALIETDTDQEYQAYLTPGNSYEGVVSVPLGKEYKVGLYFSDMELYQNDLSDTYIFSESEAKLTFHISKISYDTISESTFSSEKNNDIDSKVSSSISKDTGTSEILNIEDGNSVIGKYNEAVSFIKDNKSYENFLVLYCSEIYEKHFYKADAMNTKEMWDSMSSLEKFNYYITYYMPYQKMMNYEFVSAEDYIGQLDVVHKLLSSYERGEEVYKAICDVWRWHWQYWIRTGNFYNFYSQLNPNPIEITTDVLTEKDKNEINEVRDEARNDSNGTSIIGKSTISDTSVYEETKNVNKYFTLFFKILKMLESNLITILILLGVGVAFLIIKNKNKKDLD